MEGLLEIVVEIDSLRTLRAYKPLENLHAPAPPGVWVLQSDDGPSGTDHPSLSPPLYNGRDAVGNQRATRQSWQVLFH